MRGMGGMPDGAMRGMGGMQRDPMGTGIKTGERRKYKSGLIFVSRQTTNAVQASRAGDLIVACLRRDGSAPSLATGWTIVKSGSSTTTVNMLVAYKFATTNSVESPSWGTYDTIEYLTFRNVSAVGSSVFSGSINTGPSTSVPAVPSWGNLNSYELVLNGAPITGPPDGFELIPESARSMISLGKLESAPSLSYTQSSSSQLAVAMELRATS